MSTRQTIPRGPETASAAYSLGLAGLDASCQRPVYSTGLNSNMPFGVRYEGINFRRQRESYSSVGIAMLTIET